MPTLEFTDEQIKHVQLILKEYQPSRTRLTRDDKDHLIRLLGHEIEAASSGIVENEHRELYDYEIDDNEFNKQRIEIAEKLIKKLR